MESKKSSYRPDIDGLRAIAVLSVVLNHARLGLPGGYIGVDVFFVISGYLITGIIIQELERKRFSLVDFWERRFRRIVPALVAVTVVTLIAGWFILVPDDYLSLGRSIVGIALLISNIQFWSETGYFERSAELKPMLHTWSLAVEEQFYLLLPVALWLLDKYNKLVKATALFWMCAIVSFASSLSLTSYYPAASFYLLPGRGWELLAGAILACSSSKHSAVPDRFRWLASWVGVALIIVPGVVYDEHTPFPGVTALPPVVGTVLLIWSGSRPTRFGFNRVLCWKPLVLCGLISYSLYLWHWPVLVFAKYQSWTPIRGAIRILLVIVSIVIAFVSWWLVETPFRKRWILPSRPDMFRSTGYAFITLLCCGGLVLVSQGFPNRLPDQARRFAATEKLRDGPWIRNSDYSHLPENLASFGNRASPHQFLVWGDSHAMAALPGVDAACDNADVGFRAAFHYGWAPVEGYSDSSYGIDSQAAIDANNAVVKYILGHDVKMVMMIARWQFYYSHDPERFCELLLQTIDAMRQANVDVVFVDQVPEFDFFVPKALVQTVWRGDDAARIQMPISKVYASQDYRRVLRELIAARGVRILDPLECWQSHCVNDQFQPFDSGGGYYSDFHHLSAYGALTLRSMFEPVVNQFQKSCQK